MFPSNFDRLYMYLTKERTKMKKKIQSLIHFNDITKDSLPHYYDFAAPIHLIREMLIKETGFHFSHYTFEDDMDEIWDTITGILENDPNDVKLLSHMFDCLETGSVKYSEFNRDNKYLIQTSTNNSIFYFPFFHVALAKLPVFQSHEDYEEDFIFAEDEQRLLAFFEYMDAKQREYMLGQINVYIDTDDRIEKVKERITNQVSREDILLEEHIKTEIYRAIDEFFLHSGEFFTKYDIPYKRGILLYGTPGNGKTTLVKSIAGSVSAPIVYWQITEYTTSYSINEVFKKVTKMAPIILVIEDIDSMPEEARSVFLNTLDGASTKEGIFLIGTTNYPEKIDPALINRAGRFDRAYEITTPDYHSRMRYLQKRNIGQFISDEELNILVKQTEALSISQLNEVYMSIALQWHYDKCIDLQTIINDLQLNNKKTIRQEWGSNANQPVGFGL